MTATATATKRAKRLKVISWIILTVVPAIFAAALVIFNYGGSVKGYTDKIEKTEKRVEIIEPKLDKLQLDYISDKSTFGIDNVIILGKITSLEVSREKSDIKIEKLADSLSDLTKTVSVLAETVKHIGSDSIEDRKVIQEKLDGILKAVEEKK